MPVIKLVKAIYGFMATHPNIVFISTFFILYSVTWLCKDQIFASVTQPGQPPRPFFLDEESLIDDFYHGNIEDALRKYEKEDFVLLFLYAPWDVDSQKSRATIMHVANQLKGQMPVVAVNCWQGADTCRSQGFHLYRYPQLVARIRRQSMAYHTLPPHEEHLQLMYRGPFHVSHSHHRHNNKYQNGAQHGGAYDHIMAFVHRLLFPYHSLHSPVVEDDNGRLRASDNAQLTRLVAEYDNVVVGFFDSSIIARSPRFLHFYESSLLSLDKGAYRPTGAPYHLTFALITSSNHSHFYPSPKLLPVYSISASKSSSDIPKFAFHYTGVFPQGTLLLLRAGASPLAIEKYHSGTDLLQFLERHAQPPLLHRVFMNGVKSQHLQSILASGPSLLLLMAEDPRCRLKPLQKLLRRLTMSDRFSKSSSAQAQDAAYAEWLKLYEYSQNQHRSTNSQWNKYCGRWNSWLSSQVKHKHSANKKSALHSPPSCSNLSYFLRCDQQQHLLSSSVQSSCSAVEDDDDITNQPARTIFTSDTTDFNYPWEESIEKWGQTQLAFSCDDPSSGNTFLYNDLPFEEDLMETGNEFLSKRVSPFNRTMQYVIVDGPGSDILRSRLGFPFTENTSLRDVIAVIVDLEYENMFVLDKPISYSSLGSFVNDFKGDAFHTGLRQHSTWEMFFEHEKHTKTYKAAKTAGLRRGIVMCHNETVPQLVTGSQLNAWIDEAASVAWRRQCRESFTSRSSTFSCCHLLVFYYSPHCGFCTILWPRVITAWRHINSLLHSVALEKLKKFNQSSLNERSAHLPLTNVSLVKMDLTANTLPWRLRVERVPTLILFPASSASQSVVFPSSYSFTVPNMVEFVLANINIPHSSI